MKIRTWTRGAKIPLLALVAAIAATALPAFASMADKGKLNVVHAVPDVTVDVYANGELLLEDFKPGTITRPVQVAPGTYRIRVTPANSKKRLLSASAQVRRETDATAVAYLDGDGDPALGLYNNNQRRIRANRARVTVRHTAAAPAVDVRFKRPGGQWKDVTGHLTNGEQAKRSFKARNYRFDVVLAGTHKRVLGPTWLKFEDRTHYFLYAWGSAADNDLALNLSTRHLPVAR